MILNKKILIVEDEVSSNQMMALFFKDYFKYVFSAYNGKEAYSIYLDENIDLIITDIEMPMLNGIELIKNIRKDDDNIPIFVLTSKSELNLLIEAVPLKLEEYILKPLNFDKLAKIVKMYKNKYIHEECDITPLTNYSFKTKSLTYNGKKISLTNNEISLLELLIDKKHALVSYEDIANEVYEDDNMSINSARILISRLRKKVPSLPIESVPKFGYSLKPEGASLAV